MYKYVIVTDPESAAGFRLAGVEVLEIGGPDQAKKLIPPLLNADDTGIIGVSEEFMAVLDPELLANIEKSYRPVIIPIPSRTRKCCPRRVISSACFAGPSGITSL